MSIKDTCGLASIQQLVVGMFLLLVVPNIASAQYFGQNKMRYKKLDFNVKQTPHFEMYSYLNNDSVITWLAKESEVWYNMHQQVFQDTFLRKNPLIIYSNHPEFQQTTAISGEISVGTGGVTEAFKQRVVMPIMQINHQTRHVLGHEMVHAFQFRMLMEGRDTTRLENVGNIPLWMVEGMAEYLSIGKKDAFTAMWMRDAYARNDIPSLKQLTEQSYNYFPYRYGQAFLAFIGATYGDTVIMPMFMETAKYGYEMGIRRVFGYDAQTMSTLWRNTMESTFKALNKDTTSRPIGQALITSVNGGRMNVAPAISPDGRFVAFMSEKDLFGIDLFLADAHTGKILRKLGSRTTNKDIDEFSYLESAGDFSADSRYFAFSVFSEGKNKLMIIDIQTGRPVALEAMGDIVEFTNISFAPDGDRVAFSGLKEGQSDIYIFNFKTKELTQLTNDKYSDFQPSFSPDGKMIVFSTDRMSLESASRSVDIPMGMALVDVMTKEVTTIDIFPGANNLNPHFSGDGKYIYFLSNGDGYRNMFRYALNGAIVERLTDYFTGISGITEYSPAMSISGKNDIVYSYFKGNQYSIYKANASDFEPEVIDASASDFTAAMLPPNIDRGVNIVNTNLQNFNSYRRIDTALIRPVPYRSKFKLDYLANSGVGMTVGTRYGAGMAGGIFGIFSDILGYNQIYSTLNINGEVQDFGGQVAYVNQRSRWNWGGSFSHIPYRSGFRAYEMDDLGRGEELVLSDYIIRQFETQLDAFVAYPFNKHHRFEIGGALARYGYSVEKWRQSYFSFGFVDRQRLSNEEAMDLLGFRLDPLVMQQLSTAFVGDNSVFGLTSPIQGFRYRVSAGQYFGDLNMRAYNVDLRRYVRFKPVTLAVRAYSYIRSGGDENRLRGNYIGYPFFVRGYDNLSRDRVGNISFDDLMGSRVLVGNFEVRLPFTGPEQLAVVKSGLLFSDLNLFFDAGLAWNSGNKIVSNLDKKPTVPAKDQNGNLIPGESVYDPNYRVPVFSAGISMRVNLFGAMILEPYYAIPFVSSRTKFGTFGLNFMPGW
ncbi:DPP IV N-terminal domain-containing protein [Sphingobacterium sp. SGR-19]|uniref:DPP IV N-terminal domain-containing protein n=1 Tax=Sphingobacterium sp. SGR-19 TaxID=2710886 RepID=UPI001F106898|nr:DPP IV N-terminal domain-containing protein [Sphingobacterium sp. SGR-19]